MTKSDRNALAVFPLVVLVGAAVAAAGSRGGASVGGVPVFALGVGLAFTIQWLAFVSGLLPGAGAAAAGGRGEEARVVRRGAVRR